MSLALVESNSATPGRILPDFPAADSPLRIEQFFQALYLRYDERYVYAAPDLKHVTQRIEWSGASPALTDDLAGGTRRELDFTPRMRA